MKMEYERLKNIAKYPTGKLNSNASVENGKYPFFTCAHEIYHIDSYSYDGEYVLLGGNNASGDFPIFYYVGKFDAYQRTYLIQSKSKDYLTKYLFYCIGLRLKQMKSDASGTATKYLTLPILNRINIEKRSIEEQKKIVQILSKYDDLIELNNNRIELLEQTAEEIYKEWFVRFRFPDYENEEFIKGSPNGWVYGNVENSKYPKKWHYGPLRELGMFVRGKNITSVEMIEGEIPVISAGIEPSGYHNSANVFGRSITVSASGANAGYLKYNLTDIWCADCSYYQSKENLWFVYSSLKFIQAVISNLQVGSAQPHIYPKQLNELSLIIPEKKYIEKYCNTVEPFFSEIALLKKNNDNLIKQRDYLLPRLMSGKLEV